MSHPGKHEAPRRLDRLGAETQHGLGTFNRWSFSPKEDVIVRCPKCSVLLDNGFFETKTCPSCRTYFPRKETWAKMTAEAMAVKTAGAKRMMHNAMNDIKDPVARAGWSVDILEEFKRHEGQRVFNLDGSSRPMTTVDENFAKLKVAQQRVIAQTRNGAVSKALKANLNARRF